MVLLLVFNFTVLCDILLLCNGEIYIQDVISNILGFLLKLFVRFNYISLCLLIHIVSVAFLQYNLIRVWRWYWYVLQLWIGHITNSSLVLIYYSLSKSTKNMPNISGIGFDNFDWMIVNGEESHYSIIINICTWEGLI